MHMDPPVLRNFTPISARRLPGNLLENAGKVKIIVISDFLADLLNGKLRFLEEAAGILHPHFRHVLGEVLAHFLFKQPADIVGVDVEYFGKALDVNILEEILIHIIDYFLNHAFFGFLALLAGLIAHMHENMIAEV